MCLAQRIFFNKKIMQNINSVRRILIFLITILASLTVSGPILSGELTTSEVHHFVSCPDPSDAPCIMKRPFNSMDYTLFTKDVNISEGNGVWIVSFPKIQNKTNDRQIIRVMDFYGVSHVIETTITGSKKSETVVKPKKSNVKAVLQENQNSPPSTSGDGKPISLEKYIAK
jgi:hypothetical protein